MESISLIWFKRDLRLADNAVLASMEESKFPILIFYIFEPSLIKNPNYDTRHWRFVWQSLVDLKSHLVQKGHFLNVYYGEMIDFLKYLSTKFKIQTLNSHEETGLKITFDRDKTVKDFCKNQQIVWHEFQQFGVIRRITRQQRNNWSELWISQMQESLTQTNFETFKSFELEINFFHEKRIPAEFKMLNKNFQPGGETMAWKYLNSFFNKRYIGYSKFISKPFEARETCSRVSPYLAWGNVSIKQVYHGLHTVIHDSNHKRDLLNFQSRLFWHCHFIQKFESDCRIEFENFNRAFDAVRNEENDIYISAWENGQTGYPLVDACIRCVKETGYLNFRMRAMVVSFLTHNLFQHWKFGVEFLARQFLDFEPGIHYPQFQMQALTQGTNTMRIYNPVKQSQDHDPKGFFIRKWCPELNEIPAELIHEPWKLNDWEQTMYNCQIGIDYPYPIVDHETSARFAKEKLSEIIKSEEAKLGIQKILKKHHRLRENEEDEGS